MRFSNKFIRNSLVCGVGLSLPLGAQAVLEEVVVTAQKRQESLSDVPISVSAFTGETMEALGITDASELVEITPGLQSNTQAGSNRNYFLRGIGTSDFHLTAAPAVGQYFDGITLTSGFLSRAALYDMERVEVLKGPQNTLFGLNTTGGAVNYISKKPEIGSGTSGSFKLKLATESLVNTEGAVGFDMGDSAAGRIAFTTNKHDGGISSVTDGREFGDDDMQAIRAAFLWEPSDESSLLFNIHAMDNENNGPGTKAMGTRHPDGSGNICPDFNPNSTVNFESNTNCLSRDGGASGQPATDPSTGDWQDVTTNFGLEDINTKGVYLKYDYDFESFVLNFITAFDTLEFQVALDADGGATVGAHLNQEDDRDTLQHELRLISTGDGDFRWITGVYYLDEDSESFTGILSPGIGGAGILPNVQLDHTKENLGVYFQGEYDFSDAITLTFGVRWSDEELNGDYLPSRPSVIGTELGLTVPIFADQVDALVRAQNPGTAAFDARGYEIARQISQELTNEDVGYTVKLDWKATDDSLVYLGYSKGFKGGAMDIRAAYALVPTANLENGLVPVDPESLEAWELGYKGSFWDNLISLDMAAFFYVYNDLQQFSTAAGTPVLDNAPESEIKGLDADLKYANDSGFYLDLGFSILDSEVTDATGSSFVEGFSLGNTPDFSITAIASQDWELDNGSLLTLAVNVNHTDDAVKDTLTQGSNMTTQIRTQEAYTIVNANLTYRFGSDQRYGVSIFGNNLGDEHYCNSNALDNGNAAIVPGPTAANVLSATATCRITRATWRTYGASFSVSF